MNNTMNKFLTGAITATMVASAVAPVVASADEKIDFTDIQKSSSHYPNVIQAAERGLMTGIGNGKFDPIKVMSRGQVVKALGKYVIGQEGLSLDDYVEKHDLLNKVKPFADVPVTHKDTELFKFSLVVKDAGVFSGDNNHLKAQNNILRQHMSKVLVNAFNLQDISDKNANVTDINTVPSQYKEYVEILAKHDVTKSTDGKFRPSEQLTRQQMASFLNRAYDAAHETQTIQVKSVNQAQLEVQFSEVVDKASILDNDGTLKDGVFTLDRFPHASSVDMNAAKGTLSKDGKSLTITVSNVTSEKFEGRYELTIAGVKTSDGKNFATYEADITFDKDTVAPKVTGYEQLLQHTVNINFSEPMQAGAIVEFRDKDHQMIGTDKIPTTKIATAGDQHIKVDLSKVSIGEKIHVTIKNAKDLAGNLISPQPSTIVIAKKELAAFAPTIQSISQKSAKTFNIKFSEPVTLDLVTTSVTLDPTNQVTSIEKVAADEYKVTTANNLIGVTTIKVAADKVTNKYGEIAGTSSATLDKLVTFLEDTTPPKATAKLTTDKNNKQVLALTFDKEVTLKGNKEIRLFGSRTHNSVKSTVDIPTLAVDYADATNKKVIHVPLAHNSLAVSGAAYSLTIRNANTGPDNGIFSESNQSISPTAVTFTRGTDGEAPIETNKVKATVSSVTPDTGFDEDAKNDYVKVTFDQEVDGGSATNIENYSIADAVIESATILASDEKSVILQLKQGSVTDSYERTMTIKNVKAKHSTVTMEGYSTIIDLTENVRPTLTNAKITGDSTITLTFSKSLQNVDPNAFFVKAGIDEIDQHTEGASIDSADDKKVVIKLASSFTTTQLAEQITVEPSPSTANFKVADKNGNLLSSFTSFTVTKPETGM